MIDNTQKRDGYSAIRWSAASRYGAQGMQFVISLVLARLLAPEYFGLMGMATVVTGFAKVFNNLGFSAAIIQRKDVDRALLSTIFWVNLALCSVVTLGVVAIAPLMAQLYSDPRVQPLIMVLALNLLISAFITVPSALLQKQLDFRRLAIRELGGVAMTGTIGLTGAALGWGVWALVAASLAGQFSAAILLNLSEPFLPSLTLDRRRLRECVRFGVGITGTNIFNYFARNADNLIIGVFLGPVALGYYAFAYKLMLFPRNALTQVVNRVLFPKLSSLQDNDVAMTRIVTKACIAISAISFPMMGGAMVLADPATRLVLGEKWLPAVPIIWVLAPIGAMQSLWSIATQIMLAKGKSGLFFRWGVANGLFMISSFFVGIPWGVLGVAISYAIACLFWVPVTFWLAFRLVNGLTTKKLLSSLVPYAALTLGMMLIAHLSHQMLTRISPPVIAFAGAILVGFVFYLGVIVLARMNVLPVFFDLVPRPIKDRFAIRRKILRQS